MSPLAVKIASSVYTSLRMVYASQQRLLWSEEEGTKKKKKQIHVSDKIERALGEFKTAGMR